MRAFVIRPFEKKKDSEGTWIDFERVHDVLIAPALLDVGLAGGTTGQIVDSGDIREDIFNLIIEADLIVCDVTLHNANVFYELGIRHALRRKRSVLIKGKGLADATPFDLRTGRYVSYSVGDPADALPDLIEAIRATIASDRETDSPVFKMLPNLQEVNPAEIQAVPPDFTDDVARAAAAKSAAWLRLLASEVANLRSQWPALRSVAQAQEAIADYQGARSTLESILAYDPDDVAANLALANFSELSEGRCDASPAVLVESNLAIGAVLRSRKATAQQLTAARILRARNLTIDWRSQFEAVEDLAKRREVAISQKLKESYEAYWKAHLDDLNHYASGLAALQLGTVALGLSNDEGWQDVFDDVKEASAYQDKLKRQLEALRPTVLHAIDAARGRLEPNDPERPSVELSAAQFKFLVEKRPTRVLKAFSEAVPRNDRRAWNVAKGHLELFAKLGVKAELADNIIRAVESKMVVSASDDGEGLHIVVFAGHRFDYAGRAKQSFPDGKEEYANRVIRDLLVQAKNNSRQVHVLASAVPECDILCHEICRELQIRSTICLPMPKADFARLVFGELESWRARFLALVESRNLLQLSGRKDLPRWLQSSGINLWERGNRWVLEMAQEMAQARGARISLIALRYGDASGSGPGGAAHMMELARAKGEIKVVPIEAAADSLKAG